MEHSFEKQIAENMSQVQWFFKEKMARSNQELWTFLLGECMTGAGGEGGPLGIFLFVLKYRFKCFYIWLKNVLKIGYLTLHESVVDFKQNRL